MGSASQLLRAPARSLSTRSAADAKPTRAAAGKAKKAAAAEPPSDPRVRVLRVLVVPAVSDALPRPASGSGQGNVGD